MGLAGFTCSSIGYFCISLHPLTVGLNNDTQSLFLTDKLLQLLMALIQILVLPCIVALYTMLQPLAAQ
jgi:hypothetical protein